MYNSGELENWDPSMLEPDMYINPIGLAGVLIQVAIIVAFICLVVYKKRKSA